MAGSRRRRGPRRRGHHRETPRGEAKRAGQRTGPEDHQRMLAGGHGGAAVLHGGILAVTGHGKARRGVRSYASARRVPC
jgi:hypothetical protein